MAPYFCAVMKKAGNKKDTPEANAEERIKEAARKVFTQKGFKATRTRDIAQEAGINLALLNYYFRSKEKLFDLIMRENLQQFMRGVYLISHSEQTTWQQKIDLLVNYYIDILLVNPGLPLFVINEINNNPAKLTGMLTRETQLMESVFMQQIQQAIKKGEIRNTHPLQLVVNMMGLTIFPFVAAPMLKMLGKMSEDEFKKMMEQRRLLVPDWIKQTMSI